MLSPTQLRYVDSSEEISLVQRQGWKDPPFFKMVNQL